ncbi:MAG: hypothetical protein ACRD2L_16700, partial [Terriglobia bacterium]
MCLVIVDVNVAHRVLLTSDDPDYRGLHRAFFGRGRPHAILSYGGHLTEEYQRNGELQRILVQLDRAARARSVPDDAVDAETRRIEENGAATSDDHHILGLARVSGARLLCSADKSLRRDFKNKMLVDGPRGKIYSKVKHRTLLSHN